MSTEGQVPDRRKEGHLEAVWTGGWKGGRRKEGPEEPREPHPSVVTPIFTMQLDHWVAQPHLWGTGGAKCGAELGFSN